MKTYISMKIDKCNESFFLTLLYTLTSLMASCSQKGKNPNDLVGNVFLPLSGCAEFACIFSLSFLSGLSHPLSCTSSFCFLCSCPFLPHFSNFLHVTCSSSSAYNPLANNIPSDPVCVFATHNSAKMNSHFSCNFFSTFLAL